MNYIQMFIFVTQMTWTLSTIVTDHRELAQSQVFIFYRMTNNSLPNCFGTLISNKHVLTTASCVIYYNDALEEGRINPYVKQLIVSWV